MSPKKIVNHIYNFAKNDLFLICRSITGRGVNKTLKLIKKKFPNLKICKIKSGTKVFDWIVPHEWNIEDAYVIDKFNKKIIDFKKNNLHLVSYSKPINKYVKKNELLKHIHTSLKSDKAIPYVTSYYKKYWGFCDTQQKKKLIIHNYKSTDTFKVVIKSSFKKNGNLTYGEILIPGKEKKEIFISTYICHPSMANNELSGPMVSLCLIKHFQKTKPKNTMRFVFIPETIGSIAYLKKNLLNLKKNIIAGYNLSCIGDERNYSCILSKYKNTPSDFAIIEAFKKLKLKYKVYSFLERGSDERQYNSPGVDLPIASVSRSKYGTYLEYHTSMDNFNLVTKKGILGGFLLVKEAIEILLKNEYPKYNLLCEPFMTKRGLYPTLGNNTKNNNLKNIMNFLQYADGKNSLEGISKIISIPYSKIIKIFNFLKKIGLVY